MQTHCEKLTLWWPQWKHHRKNLINDVIISSNFWPESTFTPLSVLLSAQIQFIFVLFTNYSFTKKNYGILNLDAIRRYSRGRSKILRTKTSKINSFITAICGEMEVRLRVDHRHIFLSFYSGWFYCLWQC